MIEHPLRVSDDGAQTAATASESLAHDCITDANDQGRKSRRYRV